MLDRLVLSDAAWERIAPHIIGDERSRGSSGRDNRLFVEGVTHWRAVALFRLIEAAVHLREHPIVDPGGKVLAPEILPPRRPGEPEEQQDDRHRGHEHAARDRARVGEELMPREEAAPD